MAYTLTQVRPLLTAAELALFEASRAEPIKALSAKQLASKITRTRALRDKFRDLHRRQMVQTQRAPASKRSAVGGDNARTEKKATIMAEALVRFETQLAKVQAREEREQAKKAAAASKLVSLKSAVKKAVAKKSATAKTPAKKATSATRSAAAPRSQKPLKKAPVDVPAVAEQRRDPLKASPLNQKIHANARAMNQRAQAKRDGR